MTKAEFLKELKKKLSESMESAEVNSNVQYYDEYISNAIKNGKTEQEVLDQLGEPVLIARTILETYEGEPYSNRSDTFRDYVKKENEYAEEEDNGSGQRSFHEMQSSTQIGCLVSAIVFVLILGGIIWVFGAVVRFLLPVLIPLLLVGIIYSFIKNR